MSALKGTAVTRNGGFVLVSVLLISIAIALLVFGATITALLDRQVATSQQTSTHAYYVAKAGLARMEAAVLRDLASNYATGAIGACGVAVSSTLDLGDVVLEQGGAAVASSFDGFQHFLSYDISDEGLIYLRSTGVVGPGTQTVQIVADIGPGPAGVYDNAIFATNVIPGSGAVRGTISVYGSMHIINGNLTVDQDAISFGGTAGIYNRYEGNPDNTQTSVSDESQNVYSDLSMRTQDLCTRVKIKSGNLEIGSTNSGAGTRVGAPGTGDPNPNAIEGIYLGNGQVTSKTRIVDGSSPDTLAESYVFSRSAVGAYSDTYDIGMPYLPSTYPPVESIKVSDSALCPWLSDTTGSLLLPPPSGTGTSCAAFDPSSEELVTVMEYVDGVLTVAPGFDEIAFPSHGLSISSTVEYAGSANIMFGEGSVTSGNLAHEADVTINGSFVPANGDYLGASGSTIALTTNGDVTLDISSSDLTHGNDPVVASIIYAAGNIDVVKQLAVFGSLVSGSVTTQNVPSVAHNNRVSILAEELCLVGSLCRSENNGFNEGLLTKMTEENL